MSASYGSLPITNNDNHSSQPSSWRKHLGARLESDKVHWTILGLTMLDAACVLLQILYTFFHECQADPSKVSILVYKPVSEGWIISFELAETISIIITCLFMLECCLSFIAFGPKYYLPGTEHWKLHIFDVTVVVSTFILDIVLRGKEREVAGLLIIFRLWRIVKVMDAVVKGLSYTNEEQVEELIKQLEESKQARALLEQQLEDERRQNQELQAQLSK
ncbi:uncharacterized protein BX664DRAFT_381349 [Halteromyces radiatus]|uniref:uncharacterized protein n=1 Tax=Halteromyces radiatus TaxID=101107 RepID=UPI00221F76B5|nr:uncharacterized protein BX664DRAFT_381349 [Halteromyces radiatus]KAI8098664.1 hypothetical protein BX664DRAFT_381349 [Halteromyces radiatus]